MFICFKELRTFSYVPGTLYYHLSAIDNTIYWMPIKKDRAITNTEMPGKNICENEMCKFYTPEIKLKLCICFQTYTYMSATH